ncbi:GntR family transcriptional regulator [Mesorhizobium sp. CO1-1-8]|uniref:GntR family transcriptional regulator n=1 Tax=Mesorhizobium sp. CO1-1-8 TaxID=2876631 RepID=UPI001CD16E0A|nr:GntR family transcriptional regulator [Mesorhizobium sp. CO1-1-8]MBZ9772235.1 GntR family transcriptional regulator [Mesorhizobium sp. CO1-1-8]
MPRSRKTEDESVKEDDSEFSSSDLLARSIVRGIYEVTYVPGQRLVEQDLMEEYKVSRSTAREAIKILKADGVVTTNPYKGAQIRKLTREDAINILAVTEVVIGLAARQAAEHIEKPGARKSLRAALDKLIKPDNSETNYDFVRHRNQFYGTLTAISGNHELARIMQKLQIHLIRNRLVVRREERINGYREIAELIDKGDAKGAEQRARRYARRTAELILPLF